MTSFRYRAARLDGGLLTGTLEADSTAAALRIVESRGLFPVAVEAAVREAPRRAAGSAELAVTLAGLAALLEAGLPVDRALVAADVTASPRLQTALAQVRENVQAGRTLSASLATAGAVPPLVVAYLRAGERSGKLAAAVARAAAELERDAETQARIRAALTYPAFLATAGVISVTAIVGYVVPRFARLLGEEGRALPATTRLLVAASTLVSHAAIPGLLLLMVAAVTLSRALRTPGAALPLHRWLLAVPGIGALRLQLASARACAALSGVLDAGVSMLAALELMREAAGDYAVGERIAAARAEVERGERLATSLARHEALTATALRLVAFGEQSGRLVPFLDQTARLESAAGQRAIQRYVTLLEPALILGFGAVVAFVAAALLQAVYSVRPAGP